MQTSPIDSASVVGAKASDIKGNVLWLLVVLGLFLTVTLRLGDTGRELLLSIFDAVLLLIVSWQIWRQGVGWNAHMVWPVATMFILVATAVATFYFGEDIKVAGLFRETIKYLGFVVGVTICGLLYRGGSLKSPSIPVLAVLGIVSLTMWFLQTVYFLPPDKAYLAVNSYSNACLALSIMAMYLLWNRMTRFIWLGIAFYQLLVLAGCITVHATAMSTASGLVLLVSVTMAMTTGVHKPSFVRCMIVIAALVGAIGALMLWFAGGYNVLRSYDLGGGAAIRFALWQEAARLVWENFPLGIGPGQFGELGYTEYNLALSLSSGVINWLKIDLSGPVFGLLPMRFVHNTILAMLVEWGIVALLLLILLFTLILRALRMPPFAAALCYSIYLIPTLLLHDGLGFRANYLILGLAVASLFDGSRRATGPE